MTLHRSRGGVLAIVVPCIAGAAAIATGVALIRPAVNENTGVAAAPSVRKAAPHETAVILRFLDLSPERLAAAGVSGLQCDEMFNLGTAYSIQADRMAQFSLAYKNLNQAIDRESKPPKEADRNLPTVAQCQVALEDLKTAALGFLTNELSSETKAKLTKIRSNAHWAIAPEYLLSDRTDQQWLALRGALAAKRFSDRTGNPMPESASQVLATADADQAVVASKAALVTGLQSVKDSWKSHETAHVDGGNP
jgi:hypothetical protein